MGWFTEGAGRGGRPDDGRGWEGRKQRREARADGSGASTGAGGEHAWVGGGGVGGERARVGRGGVGGGGDGSERAGVRGERAEVGGGRGGATGLGKREWGFGRKEAG